ncbi:MAG TPA: hypothetical protein VFH61_11015, partial [Thermoleophilia bacterium]|nr:hypothetical protein [Thermoleophilia bacterium]
ASGRLIYFLGRGERAGNIWAVDMQDGTEWPLTDFEDRRGTIGLYGLASDDKYLYFTWDEELGDIWVMDVEWEGK